eukprot:357089-Chlamydomonas_euryale.AAC.6
MQCMASGRLAASSCKLLAPYSACMRGRTQQHARIGWIEAPEHDACPSGGGALFMHECMQTPSRRTAWGCMHHHAHS